GALVAGAVLNVTRLLLVGTAGAQGPESAFIGDPDEPAPREPRAKTPVFHLYAFDAVTGAPARGARLQAYLGSRSPSPAALTADAEGMAQVGVPIPVSPWSYERPVNAQLDALARSGESLAYWANGSHFWHHAQASVQVQLETDRPVYRPGQEVRVKATALLRHPRGYRTYDRGRPLTLVASDANGQELHRVELALNAFGSAAARFTIPPGRLLGAYGLRATLSDFGRAFSGGARFQVEEYKRPEFEVVVDEGKEAWRFGERASVSGAARYYFGGPVPDAAISYTVRRERYLPWFCWWWRPQPGSEAQTVSSGTLRTDAAGRFSLAFVPLPEGELKDALPVRFTVAVEARDAGGRTLAASRTFTAGSKAYLFEISPPAGFLTAGREAAVPIRLRNLDEKAVSGRGRFALHRLVGEARAPEREPWWGGRFPQPPSLEELYAGVPNGAVARSGTLRFSAEKPAEAALGRLAEGAYRLVVAADDPWGGSAEQSIVLLSVGEGEAGLALPSVALAEHASYVPGETARFLIGSSRAAGGLYVEVWGGSYLLERRRLPGGVRRLAVPVTADHKGGFTVRWFGARDFKLLGGEARAEVPWKDKELRVSLALPKAVKPGERLSGTLRARAQDGKPVDGEALVRVYDRSLEYYASAAPSWLGSLYRPRGGAPEAQGSVWRPQATQLDPGDDFRKRMYELFYERSKELRPPALRFARAIGGRGYFGALSEEGGRRRRMLAAPAMPAAAPMTLAEDSASGGAHEKQASKGAPPEPPVKARTDFSETAFFEPQLALSGGAGPLAFRAPERLTDWRATASVLTRDVKHGNAEGTFATRKELMVRVELPRFYREGDRGRLTAVVHNETDRELSGEATLAVEEDGKPVHERFGVSDLSKPFRAKARGMAALAWDLAVPRGTGLLKVRLIVRSGNLVDAEERELPLLPSRERLVETALVALDGKGSKTLELPTFAEKDPSRAHELMSLHVDPQLALSILNSLPFLVRYPHECTEQVLHRYVPLAIVNAFYRKNPRLAEAVKKVPRRETLTPAWDRSDPRRLLQLMESPWEEASKGRRSSLPVTDLLSPKAVEAQKAEALQTLLAYQLPDGAFPWFPGGRADPYMTLLVLGGFAEALRYDVPAPEEPARRALAYVYGELPRHLKADPAELSLLLYAGWVATSFPRSYSSAAQGWDMAKVWADFADAHGPALTPLGRAMLSQTYARLGERAKAEQYLERAMDGAREDPLAGVYWQPEKRSWLWYHDTVETHAFLLRTLLAVRPKDRRIPGMVQWLLFNRKGNEWKSTKASAAAIYSLLDVLRQRGALEQGDRYVIRWGAEVAKPEVGALEWLAEPLRWTAAGAEIGPDRGKAVVAKDGP
ncbi:MAG: hypothetical protein HY554_09100, partial [Elusimicrobia bacterium]|nr:hypothetical protein [Elusimicrobiota bacterium]